MSNYLGTWVCNRPAIQLLYQCEMMPECMHDLAASLATCMKQRKIAVFVLSCVALLSLFVVAVAINFQFYF